MGNARYDLRILILRRNVTGEKRENGEDVETWPDPAEGTGRYSARRLSLTAGEEIRQGVNEGTVFLKLEIKGRAIPVDRVDQVKIVATGQVFRITAPPVREKRTTVLNCESI